MNTIRLKVRRTRSISRKHLTEALCGIVDLREHVLTSARHIRHELNCAAIRNVFSLSRFCARTLRTIVSGKNTRCASIEYTLCKCIAAAMHCICVVHLKRASTRLHGRFVILRSLRCVSLAFVRVNTYPFVRTVIWAKPREPTNLSSTNNLRKIKAEDNLF